MFKVVFLKIEFFTNLLLQSYICWLTIENLQQKFYNQGNFHLELCNGLDKPEAFPQQNHQILDQI